MMSGVSEGASGAIEEPFISLITPFQISLDKGIISLFTDTFICGGPMCPCC